MIKLATLTFNPYGENTYVLSNDKGQCIIIDPGCSSSKEEQTLVSFIDKGGLTPVMVVCTHAHIDHVCGVEFVKRNWNIPFALHHDDQPLLDAIPDYAAGMGFSVSSVPVVEVDLSQTITLDLGDQCIDVINTPGHTPGHVSLHLAGQNILLTGDTLFKESIGRTDLPGGDYQVLMESIINNIVPLGPDTQVFPGHGPSTTISHEMSYNPFITEVVSGQVNYRS